MRGKVRSEGEDRVEFAEIDRIWPRVVQLATGQRGVVSRGQLLRAGLSPDAVDRLSRRGHLHAIHRAVYVVGHAALAPLARGQAAALAYGENAHISHLSAASLWTAGAIDAPEGVQITVVGRRPRSRRGIRVHYTESLHPFDLRDVHGLSLTAPARTVIDLAADGSPRTEAAFSEMLLRRLLRSGDVAAALERAPRRRGAGAVRALLDADRRGFTRSEAERLLRKLCREAQLPQPRTNVRVHGFEVDFLWPEERVIVEVDGYRYHGHRAAFERDRRRDARLIAAGFVVIRVTWRQLSDTPLAVIASLAAALGASRGRSRAHG